MNCENKDLTCIQEDFVQVRRSIIIISEPYLIAVLVEFTVIETRAIE